LHGYAAIMRNHDLADWYHERLESHIREYQEELADDEDMSVAVILSNGRSIAATWFGYHNPNMITVYGVDEYGNEVKLLLPHTNIQVVLTKTKKGPERRSIGFQTREQGGQQGGHHEAPIPQAEHEDDARRDEGHAPDQEGDRHR